MIQCFEFLFGSYKTLQQFISNIELLFLKIKVVFLPKALLKLFFGLVLCLFLSFADHFIPYAAFFEYQILFSLIPLVFNNSLQFTAQYFFSSFYHLHLFEISPNLTFIIRPMIQLLQQLIGFSDTFNLYLCDSFLVLCFLHSSIFSAMQIFQLNSFL